MLCVYGRMRKNDRNSNGSKKKKSNPKDDDEILEGVCI